ncbi:cytochrome P450 monooxygenase [Aspergillus piperis CBS 112811]|uniref:Cytochrome P450 monooxygenase n=1 Tax=Aspergillus piperis CBS 112811 TaxID=1448313 RepID=A0A8G1R2Q1_9EURO|nr:cytochrome P450 monooxygenase [Aspergillus piperis CBS 112811]RAH58946.1 cytochrome P450 monooxygenase [Aspergillus piperis CBS 112811]
MIFEALGLLALAYLVWSLVTLEINYRRASSMGIPLVRLYIDPLNVLWMVFEPILWPWLYKLPINWRNYSFGRYSRRGWYFADRGESHQRYGPMWALVTPRDIYINVADPDAIHDIFQRRTDFIRPSQLYKVLEVYGPCISTASWNDWPRHRKVLATSFNESAMSFVWEESVEQTRQMLQVWDSSVDGHIPSVAKNPRTLSLNVLAATGFRKSFPFQSAKDHEVKYEEDESEGYRDALQTVLDNCILLMVMPRKLLTLPFAPESWHHLGKAATAFKKYMVQMLDEETKSLNTGRAGSGGLMTSFVRAMDLKQKVDGEQKANASGSPPKGLTVDEIFGNIFVINFAGHDTTANTLSFGLLLLAAYPEIQDWVAEELQELDEENIKGHYNDLFPRLLRCRAVLLETLRLFPPIVSLPKWTNDNPQLLKLGDREIMIPPHVGVHPSLLDMHIHPQYWEDPLTWKPSRWITKSAASSDVSEEIIAPSRSTYFPWSDGPQNCPGNKFSQVEFVAVMAALLRSHRVHPVANPGESPEDTRARVLATTQDVDLQLLLRMTDADQVQLACRRVA